MVRFMQELSEMIRMNHYLTMTMIVNLWFR